MPLPHIPVQEFFCYKQLWVYALQIHNIKENTDHFYIYHEGKDQKGPNEVCTFLNGYIMKHTRRFPEITELDLFSDGQRNFCSVKLEAVLYESSSPGYAKTWEYIDGLHSDIFKFLKEHKEYHLFPIMGLIKFLYLSLRKNRRHQEGNASYLR
nr:unnamed protein product [Callosobruchus analis]